MLARQQADSSEGGFAKLAPFSFFLFIFFFFSFFKYFFNFCFIALYGLPGFFWALLWVGVFGLGSSSGVKPASQYW